MRANASIGAAGVSATRSRIAWFVGALAAGVSGCFLVYAVASQWSAIAPLFERASLLVLAGSVAAHVISAVAAALVWLGWLKILGIPMHGSLATSIALTSQIAKYIPGNVAHHLGKAVLAMRAGAPLSGVAGSILGELLSAPVLAVATLGLVLMIDPASLPQHWLPPVDTDWLRAIGLTSLAAVLAVAAFSPRLVRRVMPRFSPDRCDVRPGYGICIVVSGCVMFAAAGLSFHGVVVALAPEGGGTPGLSIAVFTLAWTVGFVTPGAPAGLGVREVLIVAGLSSIIGAPAALGAAVLHRLVSAVGDVLAFALGCALGGPARKRTPRKRDVTPRLDRLQDIARETEGATWRSHAIQDPASRRLKASKIQAILLPRVDLRNAEVLELGAGSGHIAQYFAERARRVVAADREASSASELGLTFVHTPGTELPFADASFDVVIYNHVIEHVGERTEQRRHLREIRRVLKDGGLLYIAVPNRWSLVEPHYRLPLLSWFPPSLASRYLHATGRASAYDCRPLARGTLRQLLQEAGLEPEDVTIEALRHFMSHEVADDSPLRALRPVARPLASILMPIIPTLIFVARRS